MMMASLVVVLVECQVAVCHHFNQAVLAWEVVEALLLLGAWVAHRVSDWVELQVEHPSHAASI